MHLSRQSLLSRSMGPGMQARQDDEYREATHSSLRPFVDACNKVVPGRSPLDPPFHISAVTVRQVACSQHPPWLQNPIEAAWRPSPMSSEGSPPCRFPTIGYSERILQTERGKIRGNLSRRIFPALSKSSEKFLQMCCPQVVAKHQQSRFSSGFSVLFLFRNDSPSKTPARQSRYFPRTDCFLASTPRFASTNL